MNISIYIILLCICCIMCGFLLSWLALDHYAMQLNKKISMIHDWTHHLNGDLYDLKEFLQNKTIVHDDIVNLHGAQITMHADDESRFEIVEAMIKKAN